MNKSILTLSAAMLLIVASCSKSKDEPTDEQLQDCLTSEVLIDGSTDFFTHDQNGNVLTWTHDGGLDKRTYTYNNATITMRTTGVYSETYQLSQGRINSSDYYKYSYNKDGYLTEVRNEVTNGNTIKVNSTRLTWTSGNLTKTEELQDNNVVGTTTFEYSNETRPSNYIDYGFGIPYDSNLAKYFGKQSKNLISKVTSPNIDPLSFKYSKDANGNVTKVTTTSVGYEDILEYKYKCK